VIWCGIEPHDALLNLMKSIHEELRTIGFEPDRQNLVPHLTLGRIKFLKDKTLFQETIEDFKDLHSGMINIDRVILYESILRREGPEYVVLEEFALSGNPILNDSKPMGN
jgi:RNA 2',3'-cyclic 3'-phosphodiesterase